MQLALPKFGKFKFKFSNASRKKGTLLANRDGDGGAGLALALKRMAVAGALTGFAIPQAAFSQTLETPFCDDKTQIDVKGSPLAGDNTPTWDAPLQTVPKKAIPLKRARVILALGGGGTRGCAHIGVLRILEREGIPIDGIVGTSIGAIVGGLYAAGVTTDEIEHRMLDRSLLKAYQTVPIPLRVALIPVCFVPHIFGYHPYDGLYKGNRFRKYLNNSVPEYERDIRALPIPFVAVASNLLDAKPYAISKGNLGMAIQASSAIPVLRRPVPMNGLLLVDGGLQANLPAKQARQLGGDIVIAVDVDETFTNLDEKEFHKIGSVGKRVINMVLAKVDEDQLAAADIVIHPLVNNISLLSTKTVDAKRAIEQGEAAAKAALPDIKVRLEKIAKLKLAGESRNSERQNSPEQATSAD